jgi:hypothetical protein
MVWPVHGGHHPERVRLVQCDEPLGDPDPFRQFPESTFLDHEAKRVSSGVFWLPKKRLE